jgi:hypothetical protein
MNEAHLVESTGRRGVDVFVHDRHDVGRGKGMEIELGLNGDVDGRLTHKNNVTLQRMSR